MDTILSCDLRSSLPLNLVYFKTFYSIAFGLRLASLRVTIGFAISAGLQALWPLTGWLALQFKMQPI